MAQFELEDDVVSSHEVVQSPREKFVDATGRPKIRSFHWVRIDDATFGRDRGDFDSLKMPGGARFGLTPCPSSDEPYNFRFAGFPGVASFADDGNSIVGDVRVNFFSGARIALGRIVLDDKWYVLRPYRLRDRMTHVLLELPNDPDYGEESRTFADSLLEILARLRQWLQVLMFWGPAEDDRSPITVSVRFSDSVTADFTEDVCQSFAQAIIEQTNLSFRNNGISVELAASDRESARSNIRVDLVDRGGSRHVRRNRVIVNHLSVDFGTFQHEIGHVFGAVHDNNQQVNRRRRGYVHDTRPMWQTIMGRKSQILRRNVWSAPIIQLPGHDEVDTGGRDAAQTIASNAARVRRSFYPHIVVYWISNFLLKLTRQ